MTQRPTIKQFSDRVQCRIDGADRGAFLKIFDASGYPTEYGGNLLDADDTSFIEKPKTLATEREFLAEHEMLSRLVRGMVPSAKIETLYYPAGEETPKYSKIDHREE